MNHSTPNDALDPTRQPTVTTTAKKYTCPMHPQMVRDGPGSCPICGMALEPMEIGLEEPENAELRDMSRRFWVSAVLSLPLLALAMGSHVFGWEPPTWSHWIELGLATPVVIWGG